jgi:hypothetical protein
MIPKTLSYNILLDAKIISVEEIKNTLKGKLPINAEALKKWYLCMTNEDRKALIQYRLEQANTDIQEIKILIDHQLFNITVSRIYYTMFHSLTALASIFKLPSTHDY